MTATLGAEVDELRKEQGLSIRALAAKAGMSPGYVWDLISGRRGHRPSAEIIAKLAAALDVDADRFSSFRRAQAVALYGEDVDRLYSERRAQ